MTVVTTSNVTLKPGDGWVLISPTSVGSFLRINQYPEHVPVYLTVATSTPTTLGIGFRMDRGTAHFNGGFSGNLYARIANNASHTVTISIWQNPNTTSGGGGGGATAPYVGTPLGYQQLTGLGSAQALTVPTGATYCVIQPDSQGVRWRDDGTNPTAAVGFPLAAGVQLQYSGTLSAIKFIQQAATATLNISYYK